MHTKIEAFSNNFEAILLSVIAEILLECLEHVNLLRFYHFKNKTDGFQWHFHKIIIATKISQSQKKKKNTNK